MQKYRKNILLWLQSNIFIHSSQITSQILATYLYQQLLTQSSKKQESDIIEIWNNNQYFHQCLIDVSEEILFLCYSFSWKKRLAIPNCLIGFYELVKKLVHNHNLLPKCLKQFLQQKMTRILFIDCTFSAIKMSLSKLSDSKLTQIFSQQLSSFVQCRIQQFQNLFSLKFSHQIISNILQTFSSELSAKEETLLEISIDQILLCLCYASYKVNKQKVLFSKIIAKYQVIYDTEVAKDDLVIFYNSIFIQNSIFSINSELIRINKTNGKQNYFLGNSIQQQKSILQLFE